MQCGASAGIVVGATDPHAQTRRQGSFARTPAALHERMIRWRCRRSCSAHQCQNANEYATEVASDRSCSNNSKRDLLLVVASIGRSGKSAKQRIFTRTNIVSDLAPTRKCRCCRILLATANVAVAPLAVVSSMWGSSTTPTMQLNSSGRKNATSTAAATNSQDQNIRHKDPAKTNK